MLLDRFVFVLYLLLGYTWFLLGAVLDTQVRYVSIVCMILTLLCMVVVSLWQLQVLMLHNALKTHDKWSTVAWSVQHILLCTILCLDGLEWTNAVVVLGLCGLLMTATIAVVGGCACFVIMQNGQDWHAHLHLTCVTFWVIVQYMSVRLPPDGPVVVTSVPIVFMTCIRLFEKTPAWQMLLWVGCIVLHVFRDLSVLPQITFLYLLAAVVLLLSAYHHRVIITLLIMPLALVPTLVYIGVRRCGGIHVTQSLTEVVRVYNALTVKELEPIVLPLDEDFAEDDWNERL